VSTLNVVVTSQRITSAVFTDWDTACGEAVRAALDGAEEVVLVDTNGAKYSVFAELVEAK
jgi:hypothetical protein